MTYTHSDGTTQVISYDDYNMNEPSNTNSPLLSSTLYQNRQRYLTAWTQKSGSHLPSAFSSISYGTPWWCNDARCNNLIRRNKWEYQVACELWILEDSDDINSEWIWLSALWDERGRKWNQVARIIWKNGCSEQDDMRTGNRNGYKSARFVVRP